MTRKKEQKKEVKVKEAKERKKKERDKKKENYGKGKKIKRSYCEKRKIFIWFLCLMA